MLRDPVVSRSVAAIGFYKDSETLEVEFVTGSVCRYRGVEEHVNEKFLAAPSKGPFLNGQSRTPIPASG